MFVQIRKASQCLSPASLPLTLEQTQVRTYLYVSITDIQIVTHVYLKLILYLFDFLLMVFLYIVVLTFYQLFWFASEVEKIVIQNDHGENLVGLLHETGSLEIVVMCHGFRSTKVCEYNSCFNLCTDDEQKFIVYAKFLEFD